jgi:protein-S-isoprenylcysteine O-methyltransferase Ste14
MRLWHLRYAFSIEPAARRLVTSGPYAISRHPVYAGYVAQYLGMLITLPSVPFALALTLWAAAMIDRMYLEEAVLREAFPEYAITSDGSARCAAAVPPPRSA